MKNVSSIELKNAQIDSGILFENDEENTFNAEKTKSVAKFLPKKIILSSNDFKIDDTRKNFSKSLMFNVPGYFAPKLKIKYAKKIPESIKINKTKQENDCKEEDEHALSEKDASFDSADDVLSPEEVNKEMMTEQNDIEINQFSTEKSTIENNKTDDNKENIKKAYNHYSIGIFPSNVEYTDNKSIRVYRSNLCKIKNNCVKNYYKEMKYKIKEEFKQRYSIETKPAPKEENICKIIEIHAMENIEDKKEDDKINEMAKMNMEDFRKTISFSTLNHKKKMNNIKGFTIMDILIKSNVRKKYGATIINKKEKNNSE